MSEPNMNVYDADSIKVGKDATCDIVINGLFIAGTQFYITRASSGFIIIPGRGWRKVFVNGAEIRKETKIKKGDVIKVGTTTFSLE